MESGSFTDRPTEVNNDTWDTRLLKHFLSVFTEGGRPSDSAASPFIWFPDSRNHVFRAIGIIFSCTPDSGCNQSQYIQPNFNYENEIIHNGPRNGQLVQIVGEYVQGTGMNGVPATYVRVYSPDFNITGLVHAAYIG